MYTGERLSHFLFGLSLISASGFVFFRLERVAEKQTAFVREWYENRRTSKFGMKYWFNTNKFAVRFLLVAEAAVLLVFGLLVLGKAIWWGER